LSRFLLSLRHVPDDERQEVHALMEAHDIACYDTPPGLFGITAGAIWLKSADDHARARKLMDAYQGERAQRVRAAWQEARERGEAETFLAALCRQPLKFAAIIIGSIFVLMVLFAPLVVFFRLS